MAQHNQLGKWGEEIACEKLITEGYAICERNWRVGSYEIDIIAMKGNRIVFVEVKTRSNDYVDPLESIDNKKILYICRSANAYIKQYDIPHECLRPSSERDRRGARSPRFPRGGHRRARRPSGNGQTTRD